MPKYKTKSELLQAIQTEHARLEQALRLVPHKSMTHPGVVGAWSAKDVLAHLTAWEQLFLHWYAAGWKGETYEPAPVGMSRKAIDALNEQIYARNRGRSVEDVLTTFYASYKETLRVVRNVPEEAIFAHGRYAWTGRFTLADYISGNTCNHYRWAASKIRRRFAPASIQ